VRPVAATPPSERFLLVACRFTPRGIADIRRWVESRLVELRDGPASEAIDAFRRSDLGGHVVLMTLYAYGDIPVGEVYDTAFRLGPPGSPDGSPESVHLVIDHVIWEFGIPTPSVGHGHKHVLAMRVEGELPPALETLPAIDYMKSAPFHLHAGLCDRRDWVAIQRRDLISVLREARILLARPDNDYGWSSWRDGAEALRETDALIDQLEAGHLPDRTQLRGLFAPTGPIQEVSASSGWGQDFLRMAKRFDVAEARNFGHGTSR
jgi:hypothetical protein